MPTTRGSRRPSATIDSPNTVVYCGGAGTVGAGFAGAGTPVAIDFGFAGGPLPPPPGPPALGRREPAALDGRDVDDDRPVGDERRAQRAAEVAHVVAVDDADVGPVELLPPQPGRPERLDRLLQLRAEALERRADARQLGEPLLDALARVPQLRVQADAVEVARHRAHVRRDRHAVVVQDDHDRGAEAAGLLDRLERDAAGHRAVADDRDDLARVGLAGQAHALLQADRVADRGRGVAGAHDVVLGLVDRAERGEALVLADRRELVAAAREDLVRIGLVADVPEDLVARGVEQRVQRDRELARPQVRPEVAADLADRVDDVRADLLGDLDERVLVERVKVLRAVDAVEEPGGGALEGHAVLVRMKSVICSSSRAPSGAASRKEARAAAWHSRARRRAPSSP